MNTHYAYKKVLTRHYGMRMTLRPRTAIRQRRKQAIIGAGISAFIITLGFVITLNVSEPVTGSAAQKEIISNTSVETGTTSVDISEACTFMEAGKFCLTYSVQEDMPVEISLIAQNGKEVFCTTQYAVKGMNQCSSDAAVVFPEGIYFAKVSVNNHSEIQKIISH